MNRCFPLTNTRDPICLIKTIASLALLATASGCAMGEEAADSSSWVSSSKTKSKATGGSAGNHPHSGVNAGVAGLAANTATGGSKPTASYSVGGSPNTGGSAGTNSYGVGGSPNTGGSAGTNSYGVGGSPNTGGSAGSTNTCGDQEVCGNAKDDDCNGDVEEGCAVVCEDTEGQNCNSDDGHGDQCSPSDNTNGCSPAKFWAWCNRRNDELPDIYVQFLRRWVEDRCGGQAALVDPDSDGTFTYACVDSFGRSWQCTTPLVLSFQPGASVSFEASRHSFKLQAGRGASGALDWPSAATPWLAYDRDGDGTISSGAELFGSSTQLLDGRIARNGFEALADLDDNRDGRIDPHDLAWPRLLVWTDRDGDGYSQEAELSSAQKTGLEAIELEYRVDCRCDARGNCERERANFSWNDGSVVRIGEVIDVYLRTGQTR